jgi:hypothetical protein
VALGVNVGVGVSVGVGVKVGVDVGVKVGVDEGVLVGTSVAVSVGNGGVLVGRGVDAGVHAPIRTIKPATTKNRGKNMVFIFLLLVRSSLISMKPRLQFISSVLP